MIGKAKRKPERVYLAKAYKPIMPKRKSKTTAGLSPKVSYSRLTADTDRLDWLEDNAGWSLVSDDAGRWALVTDGTQNVPHPRLAIDIMTTFWIRKADWHSSIRSAIDAVSTKRKKKK